RLVPVPNHYPQANPTLLLHALGGRHLRPGRLPTEAGVLVLDAAAAVAVGRCFLRGEPMLSVPFALYDYERSRAEFVTVAAGTPACIECGICSYVCPSNLPLLQGIRRVLNPECRNANPAACAETRIPKPESPNQ